VLAAALATAVAVPAVGEAAGVEHGRIRTHDGYTVYYERVGHGPEFVLLPGRIFFEDTFRRLASPRRSLIFYDMRNRGLSEAVPDTDRISIHEDVRDLESVREHFRANRVALVGFSYLGLMVVLYANDHPEHVTRIVQLGPLPLRQGKAYPPELDNRSDRGVFDEKKWEELQKLEQKGFMKSHPREFCEKDWDFMRVMLVANPPTHVERLPAPCAMPNEWPVNLREHFRILFTRSILPLDVSDEAVASKVTMPVLTIHGRKDRNAPYGGGRDWAALLPDARLLTLDNAAHASWADEPDSVVSAMDTFLQGSWPERAERVTR